MRARLVLSTSHCTRTTAKRRKLTVLHSRLRQAPDGTWCFNVCMPIAKSRQRGKCAEHSITPHANELYGFDALEFVKFECLFSPIHKRAEGRAPVTTTIRLIYGKNTCTII